MSLGKIQDVTNSDPQTAFSLYFHNTVLSEAAASGLQPQWVPDIEYNLWDAVICCRDGHESEAIERKISYYGWRTITRATISKLKELSDSTGSWYYWEPAVQGNELRCVETDVWKRIYEHRLARYDVDKEQARVRRVRLEEIIKLGIDPYPHKFERDHTISQIVEGFASKTGLELETERLHIRVAGRIHAVNKMGKAAFIRFTDGREMLQIYLRSNELDERTWNLFKLLDLGDWIGT
ncbi:MAG TPA: OB-fold nucleic acid binding domain-containing protein, partial [Blastocatellia bacterium]|nr:OB-fold nucleic acid binding domain-containing protein [Blastocatellia bacterium]